MQDLINTRNLLESKLDSRILKRLRKDGIEKLRKIQYEALEKGLLLGKNFLISAPSASGKTLIGELPCIMEVLKGKKAAYLVPLRALATEKYTQFSERYADLGVKVKISTADYDWNSEELAQSDLYIMTYERFDSLLRISPKWLEMFKVVVVDELHTLGDPHRGPRLESTLIRLREKLPEVQIIGLSATIKNAEELARWLDAILVKSTHRPVELEYKIINTKNKEDTIKQLVKEIFESEYQFIMFVRTRGKAIKVANDIREFIESEDLQDYHTYVKIKRMFEPLNFNLSYSEKNLLNLMTKGIAYHHAGLSSDMRRLAEDLFRRNLIKIIICTSTLAAGINIPARVVVIKNVTKYSFNRNFVSGSFNPRMFKAEISPNDFHQMVGRAGRPGLDDKGTGVILTSSLGEVEFIKKRYFLENGEPKLEDIKSHFSKDTSLLEQVLVILHEFGSLSEQELLRFFEKTLWWQQEQDKGKKEGIEAFLEIGSLAAEKVIEHSTLIEDKIKANEMREVKIRFNNCHNSNAIEGIFISSTPIAARISPDRISCSCTRFNLELKKKNLCPHLYLLAQKSLKWNDVSVKNMICTSLNKKFVLDRLMSFGMVKLVNGKYEATRFGHLTVNLYLHPILAVFIRGKIMMLKGTISIFRLTKQIFEKDNNQELPEKYVDLLVAINRMHDVPHDDLMVAASNELKIAIGDIENFLDHATWILNAIQQISLFEGQTELANHLNNLLNSFKFST